MVLTAMSLLIVDIMCSMKLKCAMHQCTIGNGQKSVSVSVNYLITHYIRVYVFYNKT